MINYKIELGNKPKKDGTHPIFLRLTQNRVLKRVALGLSVNERYYNENGTLDKLNWIKGSHPKSSDLNALISSKLVEARNIADKLKEDATLETVAKGIKQAGNGVFAESFIQYADRYVESFNGNEYNTYRGKKSSLNTFKDFINGENPKERHGKKSKAVTAKEKRSRDLLFSEINLQLVKDYLKYLQGTGNSTNTVEKELSRLRAIINEAVKDDKMLPERNPFLKFKLQRKKSDKVRLTMEEVEFLYKLELPENSLIWNVRNAFLFSLFGAGIRCGDLLCLRWKNIQEDRLVYQMNKTSQPITIKLTVKAQEILHRYKVQQTNVNDFIFPFFDNSTDYSDKWLLKKDISDKNALLNKYLKLLAVKAEINKNISMHIARHTFADLSRQKTKDVYAVSKALGHSNMRITQAYLASFDTEAVDTVMDSVFG